MINLNQSIVRVKAEIASVFVTQEELVDLITRERDGRARKTLLEWLVDATPDSVVITFDGKVGPGTTSPSARLDIPPAKEMGVHGIGMTVGEPAREPPKTRAKPVYRPEMRGNVWCLYDVNNGELRSETFENKGDAKVFAGRLETGEELDEPYFHVSRS